MRTVSAKELAGLKRKGGVHVKRRLGTKKPEPEVDNTAALSGAKEPEIPAPASPVPAPAPTPVAAPAPVIDMKPFAAMSASIAASNANIVKLIENNTNVIKDFRVQLAEKAGEVKKRVPWRHKIKRDGFKLIEEIVSYPIEK